MSTASSERKGIVNFLQEFSIPLIIGVAAALVLANTNPHAYHELVHFKPIDWALGRSHDNPLTFLGYELTLHWLVNDIFMVFFFGIAAKEITEAGLPGGSLNPLRKAANPLFATLGGVFGPVGVFFALLHFGLGAGMFDPQYEFETLARGWGVPTATDIALAWLVARTVFGKGHPAINFLLLLAVADDAIGLGIIAIFYGDPEHPAAPQWLGLVLLGMLVAYLLRKKGVQHWWMYIFTAGPLAWLGLMLAHLHPALALVFIVPFLPGPKRDTGLFASEGEFDEAQEAGLHLPHHESPLHLFEERSKLPVDFGLFFFALMNAGVEFASIGGMTWALLGALVIGKTLGITVFSLVGSMVGFKLPDGMNFKDLVMAGFIAAVGLTVALFVAGEAFTDPVLQGQAKMGALLSGIVAIVAVVIAKPLGYGKKNS